MAEMTALPGIKAYYPGQKLLAGVKFRQGSFLAFSKENGITLGWVGRAAHCLGTVMGLPHLEFLRPLNARGKND